MRWLQLLGVLVCVTGCTAGQVAQSMEIAALVDSRVGEALEPVRAELAAMDPEQGLTQDDWLAMAGTTAVGMAGLSTYRNQTRKKALEVKS